QTCQADRDGDKSVSLFNATGAGQETLDANSNATVDTVDGNCLVGRYMTKAWRILGMHPYCQIACWRMSCSGNNWQNNIPQGSSASLMVSIGPHVGLVGE